MFTHEDSRRVLFELTGGTFKAAKLLIAKSGCIVGDHYHRNKEERFLLVRGRAQAVIIGDDAERDIKAPREWIVPPNTYHKFWLEEGSILLGTASKEFDPDDEVKREVEQVNAGAYEGDNAEYA